MKRNVNLIELSRDHHFGLLLGWKIRQGIKNNADPNVIAQYVSYFSENSLLPHFQEEEQGLLAPLSPDDPHRQQVLTDHQKIRELVQRISSGESAEDLLMQLATLVDDHIRYEERELFPYLEQTLRAEELEAIGAGLRITHTLFIDNFSNEFWRSPANQ
jgi:hemerythrin-like domain-containing protein